LARQCTFAGVKPDYILLDIALRLQARDQSDLAWATARSHYRLPQYRRTPDAPQLKGGAISWRVNFRKSSPRNRPNALATVLKAAATYSRGDRRQSPETARSDRLLKTFFPAYSKAVIGPTATAGTSMPDGFPCAAGFESLVPLRQGSGTGGGRGLHISWAPTSGMGPTHVAGRDTVRTSPRPRRLPRALVAGFRDLTAVYLREVSHWNKR